MSGDSLRFEEIRIQRTAGFEREGFTVRDLSPGVNLVHGPNGSGTSTTARAISRLLWPSAGDAARSTLLGRYRLAGAEWEIEIDGSRVLHRREGTETPPPLLPPAQDQERYRLSLHDLLHARDTQFARAVVRESTGGYDLNQAARILEPKSAPSRPRAVLEELEDAQAAYDRAVATQAALRGEEDRLQGLEREWREADEASRRVGMLEAALEHARAREAEDRARREMERYPAGLVRVAGDEYSRLCSYRERLLRLAQERDKAEDARAAAQADLAGSAIPVELQGEEVVGGLEQELGSLREAERIAADASRGVGAAARKAEAEAQTIGGAVGGERLAALDVPGMAALADFARRAGAVQALRAALEGRLRVLGEERPGEDLGRLEEAVRCLERWLRSPAASAAAVDPSARGMRRAGLLAAILLVIVGVGLAILVEPWLLGIALLGAFLLWPFRNLAGPNATPVDERQIHRRAFETLGLDGPADWEAAGVETVLQALQKRVVAAQREAERAQRREEIEAELRRQARSEEELGLEGKEIARRFGFDPAPDPVQLVLLAERIARWQTAHSDLLAAQETLRRADAQRGEIAARLRGRLQRLGYAELETTGDIAGAIGAFAERRRRLEAAVAAIAAADGTLRRLDADREEATAEMLRIFTALGLDPDTDETVKEWCAARKEFQQARDEHHSRRAALEEAARRLSEREGDAEIAAATIPHLEERLGQERLRAEQRDARGREIAAIRARVDDAKRSHGIEEALERLDRAREELRRAREKDVRGMIASELVAFVERATRDRLLPAVFHRAREIFARITRGQYELRLRRESDPEFIAYDTVERRERTLEELSGGTRVQLLIAVRVAFVEQQEQGVKLPLILDEVLGNSDDERAWAVMEAALELAGEGRQIFYFTAQADEVARWRQLAERGPVAVEVREIDLARLRDLQRSVEIPALPAAAPSGPPPPDGQGHAEYGRRLGIPRIDPAGEALAGVHLWYLTDDPQMLHDLLRLGPERWGSLEALVRNGGRALVGEERLERLEIVARAADAYLDAARVGVGLPVDRAALEDSRAVSNVFLDRVSALAGTLNGDGVRLIEALEQGAVRGFRAGNRESLREYLEEHGYCPSASPLDPGDIRGRVLGRVATEVDAGRITIEEVDRLLERLRIGIAGADGSRGYPSSASGTATSTPT